VVGKDTVDRDQDIGARELLERLDALEAREIEARQSRELLAEILDALPLGLTLQNEHGEIVLANLTAADELGRAAGSVGDAPPLVPQDTAPPMTTEASGVEENTNHGAHVRTWLTSRKPVRILGHDMVMSTSLDITERKRIENELERWAYFDDLTGLPNRMLMQQHVEKVLSEKRDHERVALAFIDLDNFKHINDYYSHASGDALLVKVARRIASRIRESDMLARMSGDEFVLLINPVESENALRSMIDDLLQELSKPFYVEGFEILTSASIGVSVHPDHGRSYESLRRNADTAMYEVKRDAKGGAAFCNEQTAKMVADRIELDQRLRLAIRDRKFCCAFQPKLDIHSQEVVGFETLVRWRDDNGTIQVPGSFIGLATELGLIDQITQFVLAQAAEALDRLDDAFGTGGRISVNVAAKQANNVKFMQSIVSLLEQTGRPERFMLELTEDAFVAKNQFQTQVLPILRGIGVQVSIDDFGTGYSSLSALADITADEIKIDRSFVTAIHQRPRSQSVLKAIESLGQALGMSIVAEGVETFEELSYLRAATRIRQAQGYYFSKPFFLEDVARHTRTEFNERMIQTPRAEPQARLHAPSRAAAAPGRQRSY
jgi:diguanylate cyclase (GGDEF)-like protein